MVCHCFPVFTVILSQVSLFTCIYSYSVWCHCLLVFTVILSGVTVYLYLQLFCLVSLFTCIYSYSVWCHCLLVFTVILSGVTVYLYLQLFCLVSLFTCIYSYSVWCHCFHVFTVILGYRLLSGCGHLHPSDALPGVAISSRHCLPAMSYLCHCMCGKYKNTGVSSISG